MTRVGIGYDVHKLDYGYKLILGGLEILYEKGLVGHSDADVLTHAIIDALLGAAGCGDIGDHFPDTSDEYEGIDSQILLKRTLEIISEKFKFFEILNIDATIIAQAPKLANFKGEISNNLSTNIGISSNQINIKATTEEHLGFTGEKLGIKALAVCTIETSN